MLIGRLGGKLIGSRRLRFLVIQEYQRHDVHLRGREKSYQEDDPS